MEIDSESLELKKREFGRLRLKIPPKECKLPSIMQQLPGTTQTTRTLTLQGTQDETEAVRSPRQATMTTVLRIVQTLALPVLAIVAMFMGPIGLGIALVACSISGVLAIISQDSPPPAANNTPSNPHANNTSSPTPNPETPPPAATADKITSITSPEPLRASKREEQRESDLSPLAKSSVLDTAIIAAKATTPNPSPAIPGNFAEPAPEFTAAREKTLEAKAPENADDSEEVSISQLQAVRERSISPSSAAESPAIPAIESRSQRTRILPSSATPEMPRNGMKKRMARTPSVARGGLDRSLTADSSLTLSAGEHSQRSSVDEDFPKLEARLEGFFPRETPLIGESVRPIDARRTSDQFSPPPSRRGWSEIRPINATAPGNSLQPAFSRSSTPPLFLGGERSTTFLSLDEYLEPKSNPRPRGEDADGLLSPSHAPVRHQPLDRSATLPLSNDSDRRFEALASFSGFTEEDRDFQKRSITPMTASEFVQSSLNSMQGRIFEGGGGSFDGEFDPREYGISPARSPLAGVSLPTSRFPSDDMSEGPYFQGSESNQSILRDGSESPERRVSTEEIHGAFRNIQSEGPEWNTLIAGISRNSTEMRPGRPKGDRFPDASVLSRPRAESRRESIPYDEPRIMAARRLSDEPLTPMTTQLILARVTRGREEMGRNLDEMGATVQRYRAVSREGAQVCHSARELNSALSNLERTGSATMDVSVLSVFSPEGRRSTDDRDEILQRGRAETPQFNRMGIFQSDRSRISKNDGEDFPVFVAKEERSRISTDRDFEFSMREDLDEIGESFRRRHKFSRQSSPAVDAEAQIDETVTLTLENHGELQSQLREAVRQLGAVSAEKDRLSGAMQAQSAQLVEKNSEITRLQTSREQLTASHSEALREKSLQIVNLQSQIGTLQEALATAKKQISNLSDELVAAENALGENERQIAELQSQLTTAESARSAAQEEVNQRSAELARLAGDLNAILGNSSEIGAPSSATLGGFPGGALNVSEEVSGGDLAGLIGELGQRDRGQLAEIARLGVNLAAATERGEATDRQLTQLQAALRELRTGIGKISQQLKSMIDGIATQVTRLVEQLQESQNFLAQRNEVIEGFHSQLGELQEQNGQLSSKLRESESNLAEKSEVLDRLQGAHNQALTRIHSLEGAQMKALLEIGSLRNQLGFALASIQNLNQSATVSQAQYAELDLEFSARGQELHAAREELRDLKERLKINGDKSDETSRANQRLGRQVNQLGQTIARGERQLTELQGERDAAREEMQRIRANSDEVRKAQYRVFDEILAKYKEGIEVAKARIAELENESTGSISGDAARELELDLASVKEALQRLEERNLQLKQGNSDLEAKNIDLAHIRRNYELLQTSYEALMVDYNQFDPVIAGLRAESDQKGETILELHKELEARQGMLNLVQIFNETLQGQLNGARATEVELRNAKAELEAEIGELGVENAELEQKLSRNISALVSRANLIALQNQEMQQGETRVQNLMAQIGELQSNFQAEEGKSTAATTETAEGKERIAELEISLKEINVDLEAKVAELKFNAETIASLVAQNSLLTKEIQTVQEERAEALRKQEGAEAESSKYAKELGGARSRLGALQQEKEGSDSANSLAAKTRQKTIDQLTKKIDGLEIQLAESQRNAGQFRDENEGLREKQAELMQSLESLQTNLAAATGRSIGAQRESEESKAELERKIGELAAFTTAHELTVSELERVRAELQVSKNQLGNLKAAEAGNLVLLNGLRESYQNLHKHYLQLLKGINPSEGMEGKSDEELYAAARNFGEGFRAQQDEIGKLKAKIAKLEQTLENLNDEAADSRQKLQTAQGKLAGSEERVRSLEAALETGERKRLEEQAEFSRQISDLNEQIDKLAGENEEKAQRIIQLSEEITAKGRTISENNVEITKMREGLERISAEKRELEENLMAANAEKETLTARITELESELKSLRAQNISKTEENRKKIENLNGEKAELETKLAEKADLSQSALNDLTARLEELNARNSALESELNAVVILNAELTGERDELRGELEGISTALGNEMGNSGKSIAIQIKALKSQNAALVEGNQAFGQSISALQQRLAQSNLLLSHLMEIPQVVPLEFELDTTFATQLKLSKTLEVLWLKMLLSKQTISAADISTFKSSLETWISNTGGLLRGAANLAGVQNAESFGEIQLQGSIMQKDQKLGRSIMEELGLSGNPPKPKADQDFLKVAAAKFQLFSDDRAVENAPILHHSGVSSTISRSGSSVKTPDPNSEAKYYKIAPYFKQYAERFQRVMGDKSQDARRLYQRLENISQLTNGDYIKANASDAQFLQLQQAVAMQMQRNTSAVEESQGLAEKLLNAIDRQAEELTPEQGIELGSAFDERAASLSSERTAATAEAMGMGYATAAAMQSAAANPRTDSSRSRGIPGSSGAGSTRPGASHTPSQLRHAAGPESRFDLSSSVLRTPAASGTPRSSTRQDPLTPKTPATPIPRGPVK